MVKILKREGKVVVKAVVDENDRDGINRKEVSVRVGFGDDVGEGGGMMCEVSESRAGAVCHERHTLKGPP